ncbi:MAG: MTH938/NDUFAF3 family protein [Spirochaetales bacterium]|jgi:hypothetical protein|nr:MTH938/NDUFAF3 family protein [Spirochaetales bacterium]
MIDSVSLGKLLFQGKVSRADTIVFKNHMDTRWWIKSRTTINIEDLDSVFAAQPQLVTVGLGFRIPIKIADEAVEELKKRGAEVFVGTTEEAVKEFNANFDAKAVVGLFHLV